MSITVFGSINVDLTAYVDSLPVPGVTAHARSYTTGLGGKGANQAVAAQRLSQQPVKLVAAIGEDAFAEQAISLLTHYGVGVDNLVRIEQADTGIALIHVDAHSQNTITVVGGANMNWPNSGPASECFQSTQVALFQLETPISATAAAMSSARSAGAVTILDPAPAPGSAERIETLLKLADILTPNENEAATLTGIRIGNEQNALDAARVLLKKGVGTAVVKLGAKGLVYASHQYGEGQVAPFTVQAVDTVAAGDCFNGALAVALSEGRTLPEALRFAAAAGALATTRQGAASAAPTRSELEQLMANAATPSQ
ncbi:Ribokinase [Marinobacterium lacunae]|uniref:Ribokinase n=1 Tax=Marinobacterium lacunae TaxID=1232683 RepID=A0A081FUS8_9GAMM|nr:ribokinase [Marinobacterium lacunae]KEA62283.1 Ribokinase [Marinobacterium lacunae]